MRELIEDIRMLNEPLRQPRRGYFDPKRVDRVTFYVLVVSLFLAVVTLLGTIWGLFEQSVALRFIGSVGVLVLGCVAFRSINTQFD